MDTNDITVTLTAAPAMAYREFLYHPDGDLARWIATRFEVVAAPVVALMRHRRRATSCSRSGWDNWAPGTSPFSTAPGPIC